MLFPIQKNYNGHSPSTRVKKKLSEKTSKRRESQILRARFSRQEIPAREPTEHVSTLRLRALLAL
jgi:hypothetical protein